MKTTSKGTGELIKAAYDAGFRRILLGVGGSATNDGRKVFKQANDDILLGGLGALQALGLRIFIKDDINQPYEPDVFYGSHLSQLHSIEYPSNPILEGASIEIACDVTSPFIGERGAVYVCKKSNSNELTLHRCFLVRKELVQKIK